ncbi:MULTISPECIES: hypothetical protein [unclassified Variovorax]|uniref:hypothetical protein n=1 Tax=unclassified Variovorax TaxID=663243 RepID=UPI00076D8751|nr:MULTISPECIES: hypothetical protein [unclassified Variovorax]KWT98136.1 hypothetical protein APY03_0807 [Variovorax sp. WDL1]
MSKVSEFELEDLGETNSLVIRNLLRSVLQPVLGERSIRYLSTDYGAIVGGGLPYHHDMPYSNGIFGAWCIEGPPERTVRFGEMDIEVPFKPGTVVVFDPAQPHALLNGKRQFEETDYAPTDLVGMVGFVALRTPKACAALGIEAYGPKKHKGIRTTPNQFEACPRTGRIPGLAR